MAERDRFELDLGAGLRGYAEDAPTDVHPSELAHHFATVYPHRRFALGPWHLVSVLRAAWVLMLAAVLVVAMLGGMLVGGSRLQWKPQAVVPPVAAPTASPASSSPTSNTSGAPVDDAALVTGLAALMGEPYDPAKVAALYAPDAVIHEITANRTQRGLEKIGERIRYFNDQRFQAVVTSVPIRQDNFVAVFSKYGTGGDLSGRALVVYELKDGKVLNQWVYPAP